jgi:hypothetical protein
VIKKEVVARKLGINQVKQEFLTQAGVSRYGDPPNIVDLMALLALDDGALKFVSMRVR